MFSILIFILPGFGQDVFTLQGRVESEEHEPLIGALVQITGTTKGSVTDLDGRFTLTGVSPGDSLLCTFVGYQPERLQVNNAEFLTIQLQPTAELLNEVVFTGYRYQKKSEVTGAIASVAPDEIPEMPAQTLETLLQGQASGVLIGGDNGVPGGNAQVLIRGFTSIDAGTEPLYIVDGVQLNQDASDQFGIDLSPLASINPQDIASIEVLKDAASTSIYGSQASNGVILITTKSGQRGKTKFNFSTYQGINTQLQELDFMNSQELARFRIQQYENDAIVRGFPNPEGRGLVLGLLPTGIDFAALGVANFQDAEEKLTDAMVNEFIDGLPTYDWFDAPYRNGHIQNYQLSASGGNQTTRFFISANFQDTESQIINTDFQRGQLRLNLDHRAGERLDIGTKLNLSTVQQNGSYTDGFWSASPLITGAILPWNPIYDEETGDFNEPLQGFWFINPLKETLLNERQSRINQLIGSMKISYRLSPRFSYRGTAGIDYRDTKQRDYGDPRTVNFRDVAGRANATSEENVNFITTQQLRYRQNLGQDHHLSAYLVWEYRQERLTNISATGTGFPNELFRYLSTAALPTEVNSSLTEWKNVGTLLNAKYDFREKIYLNASVRYDGSSRFGEQNRFGWFPSVSASWRLSQEPFFTSGLITDLKLRAGWGVTGNNRIPNFAARTLASGGFAYLNRPALTLNTLGNDRLSWEEQKEWNIGLDVEILEGRFSSTIDVFSRKTQGLLLNRNLTPSSGFSSIRDNVGELLTQGLEIGLRGKLIAQQKFSWTANFNISFQRQELLSLFGNQQSEASFIQVGEALNVWYAPEYAGISPSNGRPVWYDRNGNLTYRPQFGNTIGDENDDRTVVGQGIPNIFGGLNTTLSFGGLSLNAFFNYQLGRSAYESAHFDNLNPQVFDSNQQTGLLGNTWEEPGDISLYPMAMLGSIPGFDYPFWYSRLQRTDFIRLNALTLTYNLPRSLVQGWGIDQFSVYVRGTNLMPLTGYNGIDPAFSGPSNNYIFPNSKAYMLGVDIQF